MKKIEAVRKVQYLEAAAATDAPPRVMFRIRSKLEREAETTAWFACSPEDAETFARTLLEAAEKSRETPKQAPPSLR